MADEQRDERTADDEQRMTPERARRHLESLVGRYLKELAPATSRGRGEVAAAATEARDGRPT